MVFQGFPYGVRYLPVPSPIFGPILELIDDMDEFRVLLRVLWMLHQKKGGGRFVTQAELLGDRGLATTLGNADEILKSAEAVVVKGILFKVSRERLSDIYLLNSESERHLAGEVCEPDSLVVDAEPDPWEAANKNPGIYSLYEQNIGILTPIIGDQLREAEEIYPKEWVSDAIHEAAAQNKRSWSYISRILERWKIEGKDDGKSSRRTRKTRYR